MLRLGTDMNPIAGVEGSTAHLAIRAYQSNAEITFGSRFSLMLEITPQPGMHVYAPGADLLGYRVIGLTLADNPPVRFEPVEYPPSAIYHFEPLDERVPVYQEPFTLVRQVVVGATREAEEALRGVDVLTLTGWLDSQACDDAICYDPTSVPLSWTVTVAPHDWQRANRSGGFLLVPILSPMVSPPSVWLTRRGIPCGHTFLVVVSCSCTTVVPRVVGTYGSVRLIEQTRRGRSPRLAGTP